MRSPRGPGQPHERLVDLQLGPLRLLRPLGRGGFAPVWLAEESFGSKRLRDVAVKLFFLPVGMLATSPEADRWCETVAEEAQALCRVEHPNVVRFHSLQRDDALGLVGLVMEFVPGPSLDIALHEAGHLPEQTVLEAGINVAWALGAVHDAALVHRDIKPANVIRGPAGYKLIDFGIFAPIGGGASPSLSPSPSPPAPAGHATERLHLATSSCERPAAYGPIGTPGYIAPECLVPGAQVTPASDLYALGVTLLRLRTGLPPSAAVADGAALAVRARAAGVEVSTGLLELIATLLQPDPAVRPRHADQVARRLERLRCRPEGTAAQPTARPAGAGAQLTARPAGAGARGGVDPRGSPAAAALLPDAVAQDTAPDLHVHPPLAGRDEELTALVRALEGARRGVVHLVLITGPMGIGRSRLLATAIEHTGFAPARVLRARCAPERRQPLRPLIDALGSLSSAGAGELGLLIESVERAAAPEGPAAAGGDALEAIEAALVEASAEAPLLLALDDLQWADPSTLQLLLRIAGRAGERGSLAVLLAVRDEPYPSLALGALLARIGASTHAHLRRLRLRPLSSEASLSLAQGVGPCSPALAHAVAHGAGGVPALVVHVLLAWRELGVIAWRDDAWHPVEEQTLREEVPGVAELLDARLAACFEATGPTAHAARRALSCVALHGGGLGVDVVLGVLAGTAGSGTPPAGPCDASSLSEAVVDALINAGILALDPKRRELSFGQEMMRQAALNLTRHRPWFDGVHRALLDAIAARRTGTADAAFLAAGYERLGEAPKARRWLRRAMHAATAAGLFDEAALLGDRLAALTRARARRLRVELDIVRATLRGRAFEAAQGRLAEVEARARGRVGRSLGPLDVERRIYRLEVARGLGEKGVGDAQLVTDADASGEARLACEARLAVAGVAPPAEGLPIASEAVLLADRQDRPLELAARVRRLEINRATDRCDLALAEEDLRHALAIAMTTGTIWDRIHIEADLAILESDLGREDAAIARLERLADAAERRGMRGQLRLMLQNLSVLLLRTGRHADAAAVAARVTELATSAGDPGLGARALSVRADALLRLGAPDAALEAADEAARLQERLRDPRLPLTLLRRADILEALHRGKEALAEAREARRMAEAQGEADIGLSAQLWEALWLVRRGDADRALVERTLGDAAAAQVTRRALTLRLMAEAKAWLEATPPDARSGLPDEPEAR